MAEQIKKLDVARENGFLYYISYSEDDFLILNRAALSRKGREKGSGYYRRTQEEILKKEVGVAET
jgi:hypothetical protein